MLGLVGSHRVGKTTLAETYAEETGAEMVRVSVSKIIAEAGYDSSLTHGYDFDTRMEIQDAVLDGMAKKFAFYAGSSAITDRTPLDAMLYTLSEVGPYTCNAKQAKWLKGYMDRAFDMTNRHFSVLLCVQPGIPLVEYETSARANSAYIEHLNALALGFISDERVTVPHYFMPRHITALETRVQVAKRAMQRAIVNAMADQKEVRVLH